MLPEEFVSALANVHLPSVFNPYADLCEVYDRPNAPNIRCKNLKLFLSAALEKNVKTIWVARDLGYRGGRRTGIPLTDEKHLDTAGTLLSAPLKRATRGPEMAERTAAIVWQVLRAIDQPVVLWNVFPLHPHERDDQFSNRCHTQEERKVAAPFLQTLIDMFGAERLVAIGQDAHRAVRALDIPVSAVRHPSYGGQADFVSALYEIYNVPNLKRVRSNSEK